MCTYKKIDFEAIRRARDRSSVKASVTPAQGEVAGPEKSDLAPGPAPVWDFDTLEPWGGIRHKNYMGARQAAHVLRQGMVLFDRRGVERSALKRDTISWRAERNGWRTLIWVTVTEYAPGLLRLRNDVYASIPRDLWPFARPPRRTFELTFHWTEITTDLGDPLFAFCSALADQGAELGWPLFAGEEAYPGYAWTPKARAFIEAQRTARAQRGGVTVPLIQ